MKSYYDFNNVFIRLLFNRKKSFVRLFVFQCGDEIFSLILHQFYVHVKRKFKIFCNDVSEWYFYTQISFSKCSVYGISVGDND